MTPFFGVSLYIWSGILSITLIFLAIGYRVGGYVSANVSRQTLEHVFLATPIASAFAIVLSTLIYPIAFPLLSRGNLITGSFVSAILLLALPLIALSAMNPLLISLQGAQTKTGDGGAGRVFFISTMGSVVGVVFTAFIFIPNVTNYRALLILGFTISTVTMAYVLASRLLIPKQKRILLATGLLAAILGGAVFSAKESYLKLVSSMFANNLTFNIQAEYTSMFGNIKVAEVTRNDGGGSVEKYFVQDGLIQNRTNIANESISMYTYSLETLVHAYAPAANDVLVLGLGAGIVPRHFRADGKNVAVVDINPTALKAASDNFGFEQRGLSFYLEDARTFVRQCNRAYDAAVVDLFLGDNMPDYLMTKEFFRDLSNCIRSNGAIVMNAFLDAEDDEPNLRLLATIASSFPALYVSGIAGGNVFIVGTFGPAPEKIEVEARNLPEKLAALVNLSVSNRQLITRGMIRNSEPISDDQNTYSLLFANASLADRKRLVRYLPPHILIN